MSTTFRKHAVLFGALLGAGATLAVVLAFGVLAGAGEAAAAAVPTNTSPPTIAGVPQQGQTLTGSRGTWTGSPTDYNDNWMRCDNNGGSCADIAGAIGDTYTLTSADVGNTVRFQVGAQNADGRTFSSSVPTAVITAIGAPTNTSPPTISGTPQVGQKLTGSRGTWSGSPTDYNDSWTRCNRNGNQCADISGSSGDTYTVTTADVGSTLRFVVGAANAGGRTFVSSAATSVVTAAGGTTPTPSTGCPAGTGTIQIADLSPPARLLLASQQASPTVVTGGTQQFTVRYLVTACGGRPVQGALVYATAVPYNQFAIPPEQVTGADGSAVLIFSRLSGFPVSPRQGLLAMFARARKSGENLLAGVSSRRLFSLRVNLHG
jgi:hypothetical protein